MTIGVRLREARIATGMSQLAFAERCGVSLNGQSNFECGKNLPGAAYLLALQELGIDAAYILTGVHSAMSQEEAALLDNYRGTDEAGKKRIRQASIAQPEPVVTKAKRARGGKAA